MLYYFIAHDKRGLSYTVEVRARIEPPPGRKNEPSDLLLSTTDGREVSRVARGRYALHETSKTTPLSSDDPKAP